MNNHTTRKKVTVTIAIFLAILVAFIPLTQAATLNLTYDANGNLVTGDGQFRVYNNQNQLVTLYNGSNTSGIILQKFAYHPTEERILWKKTYAANGSLTETDVYVSGDFVQIINNSGTYNYTYIQANGQQIGQILPNGQKQFILDNIKGSATVTTNSTGGVVERTSYTPYGGVISGGALSRFNYEARENDLVAGDTDFKFRKYKPDWGIFTQPDPVIQNIYDPQSLNRYSFERNNPYKYTDPSGHSWFSGIIRQITSVVTSVINTVINTVKSIFSSPAVSTKTSTGSSPTNTAPSPSTSTASSQSSGSSSGSTGTVRQQSSGSSGGGSTTIGSTIAGIIAEGTNAGIASSGNLVLPSALGINGPGYMQSVAPGLALRFRGELTHFGKPNEHVNLELYDTDPETGSVLPDSNGKFTSWENDHIFLDETKNVAESATTSTEITFGTAISSVAAFLTII